MGLTYVLNYPMISYFSSDNIVCFKTYFHSFDKYSHLCHNFCNPAKYHRDSTMDFSVNMLSYCVNGGCSRRSIPFVLRRFLLVCICVWPSTRIDHQDDVGYIHMKVLFERGVL